jgi:hypothetical protein
LIPYNEIFFIFFIVDDALLLCSSILRDACWIEGIFVIGGLRIADGFFLRLEKILVI